jgi:hypothetical protein
MKGKYEPKLCLCAVVLVIVLIWKCDEKDEKRTQNHKNRILLVRKKRNQRKFESKLQSKFSFKTIKLQI